MTGFFVKFWGTRGSIPTPGWQTRTYGGNTPCVEVRVDDQLFICDGGSGMRELGLDLLRRGAIPVNAHLFFSHSHWDHIQGFPFFVPVYRPDSTLRVYSGESDDNRIYELLSGQMHSSYFPVQFSDLGAKIVSESLGESGREIGGVRVAWRSQVHPGGSYAYCFCHQGYKVVYATDNEIDQTLQNAEAVAANADEPRIVDSDYLDFIRDADLLIADSQYTDDEYVSKVGWGHPRALTVVDAAVQAGVKRLALFHHDPMHSDRAVEDKVEKCETRARAQGSSLIVFGAREHVELRIDDGSRDSEEAAT